MKTLNQATDNQLVKLFQEGNDRALEVLVSRSKDKIFTSINILVKDKYLAEDLFQEVFIKIIDTLRNKTYNEEGKFLPWAVRIAHNLCIDHFRKVNRRPSIVTSDDTEIFDGLNEVVESVDKAIIREQRSTRISNLLDRLPAEQREVIVLRHYGDFSFREIAEITNCSVNTSLGRMRYGLSNIRKMVTEKEIAL